jgi:hypothetical protein
MADCCEDESCKIQHENLPVCDQCGPTHGTVWTTAKGSTCVSCLMPESICDGCGSRDQLSTGDLCACSPPKDHIYCWRCRQIVLARIIGRLEVARLLKQQSRLLTLKLFDPTTEVRELRRRRGKQSRYPDDVRRHYAKRADSMKREGRTWPGISGTLGIPQTTVYEWWEEFIKNSELPNHTERRPRETGGRPE